MVTKKKKKNRRTTKLVYFSERQKEALTNQKIKSVIDFDEQYSASIKSLSIEKKYKYRFINTISKR